jgi:POT family proton-dependent oligopeptide transporter
MWERFSYYGMRAFLILYMVKSLGMSDKDAGSIYGTYTGSVWLAAIGGGFIADRFLGHYRSVMAGGLIIMLGHFVLVSPSVTALYIGLSLIVVGTGLLKPNVSILVGSLYEKGDERRDAGFSIFYMGINTGAFLGPLVVDKLAESVNWHVGFAAAGVGMLFGVIQYVMGKPRIQPAIDRLAARPKPVGESGGNPVALTSEDWKRILAIIVFFLAASLFWGAYEQAGSSLTLFADRYVDRRVFGFEFPAGWYISVQAIFTIIISPIFAWIWIKLGSKQPSSPAKFTLALLFAGLAFLLLVPAGSMVQGGARIGPWWLVGCYFLEELGEVALSPVGLSVVTKLAPTRIVGIMMGVWFLSNAAGNKIAGWAAQFIPRPEAIAAGTGTHLETFFLVNAAVAIGATMVMFLMIKPVKKLMGGVN